MAINRVSLLDGVNLDDDWFEEPYLIYDAGGVVNPMVLVAAFGSAKRGVHFNLGGGVPEDYASGPKINVWWLSSATVANDIELDGDLIVPKAAEDFGQAVTALTGVASTDSTTAHNLVKATISAGFPTLEIGDRFAGTIFRDQADAGDTVTVDIVVVDIEFEYTTL